MSFRIEVLLVLNCSQYRIDCSLVLLLNASQMSLTAVQSNGRRICLVISFQSRMLLQVSPQVLNHDVLRKRADVFSSGSASSIVS